jgi:hypothetical protein
MKGKPVDNLPSQQQQHLLQQQKENDFMAKVKRIRGISTLNKYRNKMDLVHEFFLPRIVLIARITGIDN